MLSAAAAKFGLSVAHSRSVKPLWEILSCSKKIVSFLISKSRQNLLMYLTFVLGEIWPWKRLFFPLFFLSFFFLLPTKSMGFKTTLDPTDFHSSEVLRNCVLRFWNNMRVNDFQFCVKSIYHVLKMVQFVSVVCGYYTVISSWQVHTSLKIVLQHHLCSSDFGRN